MTALAFPRWTWQNPLPQGNSLSKIFFANANTGYAVGDRGTIIKTNDKGANWINLKSGTKNFLTSIICADANTGYAVGGNGTIIKTENGGETWSILNSGTTKFLASVYFVTPNIGFECGANGTLLEAINGGATWSALTSGTTYHLIFIFFIDANTGFAAGFHGTIIKTINGGISWTLLPSGSTLPKYSFYLPMQIAGYAVGTGTHIKTINAGTTWTALSAGTYSSDLYSVYFTDNNIGFISGNDGFNGFIYITTDGGSTWLNYQLKRTLTYHQSVSLMQIQVINTLRFLLTYRIFQYIIFCSIFVQYSITHFL